MWFFNKKSYHSGEGTQGICDVPQVLLLPEVVGLEDLVLVHAVLDHRVLEPEIAQKKISK